MSFARLAIARRCFSRTTATSAWAAISSTRCILPWRWKQARGSISRRCASASPFRCRTTPSSRDGAYSRAATSYTDRRRPPFMRLVLSGAALLLFAVSELHAACGVERWSAKTGTDPQAPNVNLSSYISSTIYNFPQSTRPSSLPSNGRVSPRETTQYRLSGTMTKYVRENDSDYHLVIKDGSGRTMIVELPATNCVGAGSPFGPGIARARNQFDARFTATTSFKTTSTPVTIKGVGFWDYIHGQTGVAPNGIEVHPVLDIVFGTAATSVAVEGEESEATEATEELAPQVALPADMVRDDDGGLVRVYRGGDPLGDAL